MKIKRISTAILFALIINQAFSQTKLQIESVSVKPSVADPKFTIGTAYHTFLNFGDEKTNTHHYEFHFGYKLTPKDKVGIKVATWKMYAPMGMPMSEQLKFDESNNYPGRLRESGFGITYQRLLWKGLFGTIEILPQLKTYTDISNNKIGVGFKLYSSYHLGYHFPLFKGKMYIEPQVHCNYWPIDTNTPQSFQEIDSQWNNYFLFEPNIYFGFNFN